jgi:NADPH-dependent ferric siderophore reductase
MAQAFYDLTVAASQRVSPSMHQITLAGEALRDFPQGQDGGYFKLILEPGTEGKKALMRTYTIRRQRETEIDVLFALHGGHAAGPATSCRRYVGVTRYHGKPRSYATRCLRCGCA